MLSRSASGPGGLSINTNSANSPFGSTSTPPAAGGMFGSTQASKPLFGAATTTTASLSGGLFGSAATTSGAQSGGLFGSSAATAQPQTGNLFGSAPAVSQPSNTGGLFGSVPTSGAGLFGSSTTAQPAVSSSGLFGSTAISQSKPNTGLFSGLGQPTQNQNQGAGGLFGGTSTGPQAQTGGLFGELSSQNQNKPASSLFGGLGQPQNQQSQPQQSTMFPSLNQSSQYPLGGSLSGNQQQQTVSGVRIIDTASIRGTTRFNDLHDDIQAQIMNIDNVIQAQIKLKNDCDAIMPSHDVQLSNIPNDVDYCNRKLKGLEDVIETDAEFIAVLRDLIKSDAENAKLSFRAIDNLKLPPQYHNSGTWPAKSSSSNNQTQSPATGDAQDIVGFFSSTVDELSSKLEKYQKNVTEIEQHLRGVEASTAQHINALVSRRNGSSGGLNDELQELAESLQDFERSILHVAGKVGGTREGVQSLQLGGFMKSASGIGANGKRSGVY